MEKLQILLMHCLVGMIRVEEMYGGAKYVVWHDVERDRGVRKHKAGHVLASVAYENRVGLLSSKGGISCLRSSLA